MIFTGILTGLQIIFLEFKITGWSHHWTHDWKQHNICHLWKYQENGMCIQFLRENIYRSFLHVLCFDTEINVSSKCHKFSALLVWMIYIYTEVKCIAHSQVVLCAHCTVMSYNRLTFVCLHTARVSILFYLQRFTYLNII